MNSDCHCVVVTSVAKCSDCHYVLPQISLPRSDSHYSFFTVYIAGADPENLHGRWLMGWLPIVNHAYWCKEGG